jgi:hypothetical protein
MNAKFLTVICFLFLFCQKSMVNQAGEGFREVKKFDWSINEQENRLNIKLYLTDSPIPAINTAIVKIRVEGMNVESKFNDLMVKIDTEGIGLRKGSKCLEHNWVPSFIITKTNIEEIHLLVK